MLTVNKMKNDFLDDQLIYEMAIAYDDMDGGAKPVITDEFKKLRMIKHIVSVMEKSSRVEIKPFSLKESRVIVDDFKIEAYGLGKSILNILKIDPDTLLDNYPMHGFNPHFEVFVEQSKRHSLHESVARIDTLHSTQLSALVTRLNLFLQAIRCEFESASFRRKMSGLKRKSRKNYQSLMTYLDELFKKYSKLTILRIDLTYRKSDGNLSEGAVVPTYDQVKQHRVKLLRSVSKHLESVLSKKCLVGYVWKLEYGKEKSWHYHFIVILNGQEVRQDIVIAELIGKYWIKITNGDGLYHSCNHNKHIYKTLGIGLVDHRDKDLREGLRKVAAYLTKTDPLIRMIVPENGRAFGKGVVPRKVSKHTGRPRQRDQALKHA